MDDHTHFRALTIFLFLAMVAALIHMFSTDASLYGYGLAASDWTREDVAEAGRRSERSRYRLAAGVARGHTLGHMGFVVDRTSGKVREVALDDEVSILLREADRWEEDPAFEEILLSLHKGSRWRTLSCGRWLFEQDILTLESRGVSRAVSRTANCRPCCDCRVF